MGRFLCPRYRAGRCDALVLLYQRFIEDRFYALGIGLGVVTDAPLEGPLTCGFDVRFADLAARGGFLSVSRWLIEFKPATCGFSVR
jgi:hypothetical protein